MKKTDVKEMQGESQIAQEGTELERLDQLQNFVSEATQELAAIREATSALGNLLFKINAALVNRRIVVLHEKVQSSSPTPSAENV